MKTALIVDPSLVSRMGHHYHASKALIAEIEGQGWQTRILISHRADRNVLSELGAAASFTRTVYDRTDWTEAGFRFETNRFYRVLKAQLMKFDTLPSIVIFPTCNQSQLLGLARFMKGFRPGWKPQVLAWLLFPPKLNEHVESPAPHPQYEECRRAFNEIKSVLQNDNALHIACETETLREIYQALSRQFVHLRYPPSQLQRRQLATVINSYPNDLHLVVAGHATVHKGYELLPEALRHIFLSHRNLRATIHGDVNGTGNPDILKIMQDIGNIDPKIEVLTESLDTYSYHRLLLSADLVVLPYNPQSYKNRGSGIFSEATTLGIPVVAPMGCKFAFAAIEERRATGIENHTSASLADAVSLTINDFEVLRANAKSHAEKLDTEISSRDFIAKILTFAPTVDVANTHVGLTTRFWRSLKDIYARQFT